MDITELSKQEASAILDEGVQITFSQNGEDKSTYTLKRLKLGTILRISKRAINIERGLFQSPLGINEVFLHLLRANTEDAIYCIACALTNSKEPPSEEVIEQIKWSMDSAMMSKILALVVQMMDVQNFTSGIISLVGIDVLSGTNPEG